MMLVALEQHLTDFNFKDVRDGIVKLRQLGRIMTGSDALGLRECTCRVCGAQQLACLALRDCRCRQTFPMKISVMPADSNPTEYDWNVARNMQRRIFDAELFRRLSPRI